jgi:hypothetical protein
MFFLKGLELSCQTMSIGAPVLTLYPKYWRKDSSHEKYLHGSSCSKRCPPAWSGTSKMNVSTSKYSPKVQHRWSIDLKRLSEPQPVHDKSAHRVHNCMNFKQGDWIVSRFTLDGLPDSPDDLCAYQPPLQTYPLYARWLAR